MQSISCALAAAIFKTVAHSAPALQPLAQTVITAAQGMEKKNQEIPFHAIRSLIDYALLQTGDDDLGLLAYSNAHPATLGILGYAVMSSQTIRDALNKIAEYHHLIAKGFCIYVDESEHSIRYVGIPFGSSGEAIPRVFIDAVAALTLGLLHWLAPHERIMPIKLELSYPEPKDKHKLESLFGCNIAFSAPVNALCFKPLDGDVKIATYDPSLQAIHRDLLKKRKSESAGSSHTAKTKQVIAKRLEQSKSIELNDIAMAMSMSPHQLTKGLTDEGQNFLKTVDAVKFQRSHHLLLHSVLSFKEIAYCTGFKNPSAFNKACERWFGMSPSAYRKQKDCDIAPANSVITTGS